MARERDLAWEALVRATRANPAMERGALNAALAAIKEAAQVEGLHPDELPAEIERRAEAYQSGAFQGLTLTPTALAKHWFRVLVRPDGRSASERALDEVRRRA